MGDGGVEGKEAHWGRVELRHCVEIRVHVVQIVEVLLGPCLACDDGLWGRQV